MTGSRKPLIQDQIVGKKEGALRILDRDRSLVRQVERWLEGEGLRRHGRGSQDRCLLRSLLCFLSNLLRTRLEIGKQ